MEPVLRRTLSAPLLGRRAFTNIPLAGAIAGPDTYGGFRREFVRRQRQLQKQQRQQQQQQLEQQQCDEDEERRRDEDDAQQQQRRSQLETVTGGLSQANHLPSRGSPTDAREATDASPVALSAEHASGVCCEATPADATAAPACIASTAHSGGAHPPCSASSCATPPADVVGSQPPTTRATGTSGAADATDASRASGAADAIGASDGHPAKAGARVARRFVMQALSQHERPHEQISRLAAGLPPDDRLGTLVTRGRFRVGDSSSPGGQQGRATHGDGGGHVAGAASGARPRRFALRDWDGPGAKAGGGAASKDIAAAPAAVTAAAMAAVAAMAPAALPSAPPSATSMWLDPAVFEGVCGAAEACTAALAAAAGAASPAAKLALLQPSWPGARRQPASPPSQALPVGVLLTLLEARRDVLRDENETLAARNRDLRDWMARVQQQQARAGMVSPMCAFSTASSVPPLTHSGAHPTAARGLRSVHGAAPIGGGACGAQLAHGVVGVGTGAQPPLEAPSLTIRRTNTR
jgi:hypothetical protein